MVFKNQLDDHPFFFCMYDCLWCFSVIVRAVLRSIGVGSRISIAVSILLLLRINCRREITWKRIIININITMPLHYEFRDQLDSTRRWVGWTLGNLKKKRNCVDKDKKRFPFYFYFPTGIVLVFHLASVNVARPDQVSPLTNNDMTLSACHCTQQIITTTLLSLSFKKRKRRIWERRPRSRQDMLLWSWQLDFSR